MQTISCDICKKVTKQHDRFYFGRQIYITPLQCTPSAENKIDYVCPECVDKLNKAIKKLVHVPDL